MKTASCMECDLMPLLNYTRDNTGPGTGSWFVFDSMHFGTTPGITRVLALVHGLCEYTIHLQQFALSLRGASDSVLTIGSYIWMMHAQFIATINYCNQICSEGEFQRADFGLHVMVENLLALCVFDSALTYKSGFVADLG